MQQQLPEELSRLISAYVKRPYRGPTPSALCLTRELWILGPDSRGIDPYRIARCRMRLGPVSVLTPSSAEALMACMRSGHHSDHDAALLEWVRRRRRDS